VNFARENGMLTAVRCGGHNSSGTGSCDGGILIDLSRMNAVHVDPKTRRARVVDLHAQLTHFYSLLH
jgi:FAD/FMN-containing dehydrogenase